jgi:transposase
MSTSNQKADHLEGSIVNHDDSIKKTTTTNIPNPQVQVQVKPSKPRRSFDKAYKERILDALDNCSDVKERSALLRREGLYHSAIIAWRHERAKGNLKEKPQKHKLRIDHLTRENEQLKKKLSQAEAIIDLQKKVSELLGKHILPHERSEENS